VSTSQNPKALLPRAGCRLAAPFGPREAALLSRMKTLAGCQWDTIYYVPRVDPGPLLCLRTVPYSTSPPSKNINRPTGGLRRGSMQWRLTLRYLKWQALPLAQRLLRDLVFLFCLAVPTCCWRHIYMVYMPTSIHNGRLIFR
jgi:hypothetical protein